MEYIEHQQAIGGFLIVLVIRAIVQPFYMLYQIIDAGYFTSNIDELIRISASPNVLNNIIYAELFYNAIIISTSILLLFLLYRKRTSFPVIASAMIAFSLVSTLLDHWAVQFYINKNTEVFDKDLISTFIATLIFVPYLLFSERCKDTFVYHYEKHKN